jgi:hypothetical protein
MRATRAAATLIVFLIYVALPTKDYYWDGIWFAQTIEDAWQWPQLLHPNHLIYNLLGYGVYHALGARFRALYVLQAMDAVFGAATVYVLFGIIRELTQSEGATLLRVALFAFSGTWWRFATDADAYVPSVFFLTLSAFFLLPGKNPRPAHAALSHALAMAMHQLAIFFFPAAVVALWNQSAREARQQRVLRVVEYTATALALTLGAYILGFRAGAAPRSEFWAWLTTRAPDARFSFNLLRDALLSLRSWVQVFLIGRVTLVRFTNPGAVALLLFAAAAAVMSAVCLAKHGLPQSISVRHPVVLRWALIWLGAYALFLLVWLPHNTFYKLFALPAVILLAASCATPASARSAARSFAWLVPAVAAWNLACGIIPYSHIESSVPASFAMSLRETLPRGAVVYYLDLNADDWFARYFNPRTRWQRASETAAIDGDLGRGESVWMETTALEHFTREAPAWLAARTVGTQRHELIDTGHRIRFVMLRPPATPMKDR